MSVIPRGIFWSCNSGSEPTRGTRACTDHGVKEILLTIQLSPIPGNRSSHLSSGILPKTWTKKLAIYRRTCCSTTYWEKSARRYTTEPLPTSKAYFLLKTDDLDGTCYEPEFGYWT